MKIRFLLFTYIIQGVAITKTMTPHERRIQEKEAQEIIENIQREADQKAMKSILSSQEVPPEVLAFTSNVVQKLSLDNNRRYANKIIKGKRGNTQ